jgi:hypothetical protein
MNLALAKFRSAKKPSALVLHPGSKECAGSLTSGLKVEALLTSWLVTGDCKGFLGPVASEQLIRVEVGSADWTKPLEGLKSNGSLAVVLPSKDIGPELGHYPADSSVAFKLRFNQNIVPEKDVKVTKNDAQVPQKHAKVPEKDVKMSAKSAAASGEQQASENKTENDGAKETKARINQMIAKVGQPILPQSGGHRPTPAQEEVGQQPPSDEAASEEKRPISKSVHERESPRSSISGNEGPAAHPRPQPPPRRPIQTSPDSDNLIRMIFSEQRLQESI